MKYKLEEVKALVAKGDFDTLREVGYQGPVISDQINGELSQLQKASSPAARDVQGLLLSSIATHQGYAVQELSQLINKNNNDGGYDDVLRSGLKLATLTNNGNGCLERICSCAKPRRDLLEEAAAFANEQGLTPQSQEIALQGHKAVDVLRRALNPEKVAELHKQAIEKWDREHGVGNKGTNTGFNTNDRQQRQELETDSSPIYSVDANPDQVMERLKNLTSGTASTHKEHDYRFQTWGHAITAMTPHRESGGVFAEMYLHSADKLKNGDVLLTMSHGRQIASMIFDVRAEGNPADLYKCNVVQCAPHMGIGHDVRRAGGGPSVSRPLRSPSPDEL